MWPAIIGGAISALGSFLGSKESADSAESQAAQNTALQREFAQQGIRWRVEDAKAAGLHPLFALGGSGASFTPNPIHVGGSGIGPALESMGQGVSRAVAAQATEQEVAMRTAQLELIRAQTNAVNAQAARDLAASEAARLGQAQVATFPLGYHASDSGIASRQLAEENRHFRMGLGSAIVGQGGPGTKVPEAGAVKVNPSEITSHHPEDRSRAAGISPADKEYTWSDGRRGGQPVRVLLPDANNFGEAMESVTESIGAMGLYLVKNVNHYGPRWLWDVYSSGAPLGEALHLFAPGGRYAGQVPREIGLAIGRAIRSGRRGGGSTASW